MATEGYEIGFLLRRAHVRAAQAFAAALGPLDIEARQFAVLHELDRAPHSQRALSDLIGADKSAMVRIVDELERAGLVNRTLSQRDRRVQEITLTERGRAKLAAAQDSARTVVAALCEHMPAEHVERLGALLREFLAGS